MNEYNFFLGPEVPTVAIFEVFTNTILTILDSNSALRSSFHKMAIPQIRKFQVIFI